MALQPIVRYGRTRGRRVPTNPIYEPTSENVNAAADQRQQDWNTAALQTQPLHLGDTNTEQPTREALAIALGYKPGEPTPGIGPLLAKFASLPGNVKAGIYKAGGAQFIGPAAGAKMLSGQAEDLEKVHDNHTNDVVSAITAGKIEPIKAADGSISWVVNQEQDMDPTNPLLGKKRVQVPVNPVIKGYIERAQTRGYIPDPTTGQFPESKPLLPTKQDIQRRMSSADFETELAARRSGAPIAANLAATLASAKNPNLSGIGPTDSASTMSLTPYNYNSNMQLGTPYAYGNPLQFPEAPGEMYGPPAPPPNLGYIPSGRAATDLGINAEAAGTALVNTLTGIGDLPARGYNWLNEKAAGVNQFLFGGDRQSPTQNLPVSSSNAPLNANDAALVAAKVAAARKAAEDEQWFQSRRANMEPAY